MILLYNVNLIYIRAFIHSLNRAKLLLGGVCSSCLGGLLVVVVARPSLVVQASLPRSADVLGGAGRHRLLVLFAAAAAVGTLNVVFLCCAILVVGAARSESAQRRQLSD